jgi:hypothetical protein
LVNILLVNRKIGLHFWITSVKQISLFPMMSTLFLRIFFDQC